jgi:hypothetical protein
MQMRVLLRFGSWPIPLILLLLVTTMPARAETSADTSSDIARLLQDLEKTRWEPAMSGAGAGLLLGGRIRIGECHNYPYHDNRHPSDGFRKLAADLRSGLQQGLQCMAGEGPPGRLHPYHEANARRLVSLLSDTSGKQLNCVEDRTFAYAIAHPSKDPETPHEILIDTYRISGFLSRKFERATYRDFFKLSEPLIEDHLTGKPLHVDGMHRYRNLPALVFHEMTHWLGYEHTNLTADVVDLYEICCFGGSDHVLDDAVNEGFRERACAILKDAELWDADAATRKRQWEQKGYFRLKREIRHAAG